MGETLCGDFMDLSGNVHRQYYGEPITYDEYRKLRKRELKAAKIALDPPHPCQTIQRLSDLYRNVLQETKC
jgi:hypothetical protein